MLYSQLWARSSLPGRISQKSFRICSNARCASTLPLLSSREGGRCRLISPRRGTPGIEKARPLATLPSMSTEQSRLILDEDINRTEDIYTFLRNWKPGPEIENIDPIALPVPDKALKNKGSMLNDDIIYRSNRQELLNALDFQGAPGENDYSPFLHPGDMVVLQQDGGFAEGTLATYVRSVNEQHQFLTIRGKWRVAKGTEISYYAKERTPSELLAPILPYFPTLTIEKSALPQLGMEGGVPRQLAEPLLTLMIKFELESHKLVDECRTILADIYNELADKNHVTIMTLDEIAAKALCIDVKALTAAHRYAIHKAMKRHAFYIIPNQSPSAIESYMIRPKRQSKSLANVINWVRSSQSYRAKMVNDTKTGKGGAPNNPVELFAQKARKLIQESRKSRQPTPSFALGPSVEEPSPGKSGSHTSTVEQFSNTDQEIIDFIRLWITPPALMGQPTLQSMAPVVLRLTGMYGDYQLNQATGYLFLQEIGVISPWENIQLLAEQLALPGHGLSPSSDKIVEECREFCKELKPDTLVDSMKHLRKDWGDLPVFCVDSSSAAEIDDGFSIEPASDSSDASWVHIHVANPSAFIPPDHILAQGAARFKQSLYSPERIYPLFPPSVTHSQFSLAPKRPTITFSAKVNKQGDILDTSITSGYVNNIVYVTPSSVRKIFGMDHFEVSKVGFSVGGSVQEPSRVELKDHVSEEHQATLKNLEQLLAARREKRKTEDSLEFISHHKSFPLVSGDNEGVRPYTGNNSNGYQHGKDPAINIQGYETDPFAVPESTKFDLVSHAMLLGGEIAATWAKERGLPLIYSGASHGPGIPVKKPTDEDDAPQIVFPRAFTSSKPVPHVTLGMEQYAKCTSPLRRYSDLLAHWQIEAALRHEAESKTQFKISDNKALLPFSEPEVEAIIARSEWQNRLINRTQKRSREFWIYQLLFRAHHFNQAELPETFQCVVVSEVPARAGPGRSRAPRYLADLLPFRVRCFVTVPEDNSMSFKPGDIAEASIQHIDLYAVSMDVSATRLVTRRKGREATAALGYVM